MVGPQSSGTGGAGVVERSLAALRSGRRLRTIVILSGVYFAAAKLGLTLAVVHPSATPVWPPTGIALAALLLMGYHAWPGIFLGAFLANLTTAGTVWTSLGIATGNTLEALVGAYLVNTYAGGRNVFNRPQDIFKFALLAAVVGTTVSATTGVVSLALGGFARWDRFAPIWLTWWLGDAGGALLVAPLLVLWGTHPYRAWTGQAMLERGFFLLTLSAVSWVVFGGVFAFAYLTMPFLVWAAFRFDERETATVIALLAALAIWGTVKGHGPFVGATPNESLLLLQIFMGLMVLAILPLSSVIAQREAAERKVRESERRFRALAEHSSDVVALLVRDGAFRYVSPAVEGVLGYRPDELVGCKALDFVPPADLDLIAPKLAQALQPPARPLVIEHTYRHKDGSIRWVETTITNMLSEPSVHAIVWNLRDITGRKHVEQALRRKQVEDELIGVIATKTAGETDVGRMLTAALRELQQKIAFTGGSIAVQEGEELIIRAAIGPFAEAALGQRMPRGEGRVWQIVDTGAPFLCNDLVGAGLRPTTPIQSYLAVPLTWQGRAFGVLEVDSVDVNAFQPADLDLMRRVAAAVSGSIELARRYAAEVVATAEAEAAHEERGRLYERVSTLQGVTAMLSQAVTPEQVIGVIVEQGARAMGAQAAAYYHVTDQGNSLELARAINYPDHVAELRRRQSLAIATWTTDAVRHHDAVFLESGDEVLRRYPHVAPVEHLFPRAARAAVPLIVGARPVGVLVLNFARSRRFEREDKELILAIARQCAQALERAQLYEREHTVAETLQRALLPEQLPQLPGVEIRAAYVPGKGEAEIGGDWYDVFRLPNGHIAVSVGDVVGRGLQAAVVMGQLRQAIRAAALVGHSPPDVLNQANDVLRLLSPAKGMATAAFGVLDPAQLMFTYVGAGHPPPVLATPDGRVEALEVGVALPLGVGGSWLPSSRTISLPQGSLLVLYTDGLIELTRNIDEGEAALKSAAAAELQRSSGDSAQAILHRVMGGRETEDDIVIVTVSVAPHPLEQLLLTLPAEPASTREVRQAFRRLAEALHLDRDRTAVFEVALGEAVTNVVEHAYGAAGGELDVHVWQEGDTLIAEIKDRGRWRTEPREGRGHGLQIMRSLLDSVEVERGSSGTIVRISLARAPSPARPRKEVLATPSVPPLPGSGGETVHPDGEEHGTTSTAMIGVGRFQIAEREGVPVVNVSGDVDLANAHELAAAVEHAARLDKGAVVVDLAVTSFLDSKAVHVLLRMAERLATNRQRLVVVAPQNRTPCRVLEIAGLTQAVPVYDSLDRALADVVRGNAATS